MSEAQTEDEESPAIRLYADENFPRPAVQELRNLGYDVWTVQEAGQGEQRITDDAVLAFAHLEGRAVVTHNRRDFIHLHRQSAEHSGIIVCTVDHNHLALALRIKEAITGLSSLDGQLVKVNRS